MLKNCQQDFQQYLLQNKKRIPKNVISTQVLSAKKRLQIYQNSYYERIIAAMQQDFPELCESIGVSAFSSLVIDYITHYPSTHYNLRYVGQLLSAFILSRDPEFKPYADLAHKEWLKLDI